MNPISITRSRRAAIAMGVALGASCTHGCLLVDGLELVEVRERSDKGCLFQGVEVPDVAGLERPPIDAVHAHERAVFESNQRVVDVPRVGQMRRDGQLPSRHGPKRQLVLQRPQHFQTL